MSHGAIKRLRKEYQNLLNNPPDNIIAYPKESNLLECHYCLMGAENSPYEGGYYYGIITFPSDYPFKPPAITMTTPNGRFATCVKLCLSMSDFHPETWNPLWSVSTILLGLYSFMLESDATNGSIVTTSLEKQEFAKKSLEFNCTQPIFCELFPELVQLHLELTGMGDDDEDNSV